MLIAESKVFKSGTIFSTLFLFNARGKRRILNPFFLSLALPIMLIGFFCYSIIKIGEHLAVLPWSWGLMSFWNLIFMGYITIFLVAMLTFFVSVKIPGAYKKMIDEKWANS